MKEITFTFSRKKAISFSIENRRLQVALCIAKKKNKSDLKSSPLLTNYDRMNT